MITFRLQPVLLDGMKLAVRKSPRYQLEGFKFQTYRTQVTQWISFSFSVIFPICPISLESAVHRQSAWLG